MGHIPVSNDESTALQMEHLEDLFATNKMSLHACPLKLAPDVLEASHLEQAGYIAQVRKTIRRHVECRDGTSLAAFIAMERNADPTSPWFTIFEPTFEAFCREYGATYIPLSPLNALVILVPVLRSAAAGAKTSQEQCRAILTYADDIMDKLQATWQQQNWRSSRWYVVLELRQTFRSAISLFKCCSSDKRMHEIVQHESYAEQFNNLYMRLADVVVGSKIDCKVDHAVLCKAQAMDAERARQDLARMQRRGSLLANVRMNVKQPEQRQAAAVEALQSSTETQPIWILNKSDVRVEKDADDMPNELGRGSFGIVLSGTFRRQAVAIKTITLPGRRDRARFQNEVGILCRLRHPNIVHCHGAWFGSQRGNIVMERLGWSVWDILYNDACTHQLTVTAKVRIAYEMAQGMLYLHTTKPIVVHRDLKPENVMLDRRGCTRIVDFGLAETKENTRSTMAVRKAGTSAYMAPELLRDGRGDGKDVDAYAYGITVNEMFAGVAPYAGQVAKQDIERAVIRGTRPRVADQMPKYVLETVEATWTREASERARFHEIVRALECRTKPVRMRPVSSVSILPSSTVIRLTYTVPRKCYKGLRLFYTGTVMNGVPHGKGHAWYTRYRYLDGDTMPSSVCPVVYEGEWKDGLRCGKGKLTFNDRAQYCGEFRDDNLCGEGTFTWSRGNKYVGQWHDGRKHGEGTYTFENGDTYEGTYSENKFSGYGTFRWANGDKYMGNWENGLKNGHGSLTRANGYQYIGKWKDDRMHGRGTEFFADPARKSRVGEWVNDVFVE